MTIKDFLFKFCLGVGAIMLVAYVFTYFEANGRNLKSVSAPVVLSPQDGKTQGNPSTKEVKEGDAVQPSIGTEAPEEPSFGAEAGKDSYSLENYPISNGLGGSLKDIAADSRAITIIDDTGIEYRVIIIDATEVFRTGERVGLSAIKETDRITVLGRKKSVEGAEFVADSIYAVEIVDTPAAAIPSESPIEE